MDIRGVRIRAMREQCLDRGELTVRYCEHKGRTAVRIACLEVGDGTGIGRRFSRLGGARGCEP